MELTYLGDIFISFICKIKAHAEEGGEEALNKVIHGMPAPRGPTAYSFL